ncbi:MAG: SDR family NAD(P)-dependent oxidoreductase [Hydrococcus sp. Prado102]|jgi:acyl transferase domain-containing protein/acyl carrier protein|nr:SDR family NAD(P)-dependent oxidoreductase [Hydrococcus sp. Prado102]
MKPDESIEEIAIIGMAGRFPKAKTLAKFWQNLQDGVESISKFADEEIVASGIEPANLKNSNYVKAGAILDDIDLFDAFFFDINPKEAAIIDPQHRLFLECAWEALEDAGYDSQKSESRIGVYAGASLNNYNSLDLKRDRVGSSQCYQTLIGNDKDYLATRVSYKLNLTGPSITVQTACSTSLVATTLACQSLLNYQCDLALAGGVSIRIPQKTGYLYEEGGVLSPDGHCRAFDAKAKGTTIGNGAGVVVLKRLSDAIADGDNIYAVIKGSAINNDGSGKVGYTAPSVNGQAEVIAEAHALARIEAETVTYIEAHGSGTILGDPLEIEALTQVFRASTDKKGFCAIGSVKTNIGHLDAAAGVTSLIKTVLALKHKQIPPSLHYEQPNPQIDFANSPFYVNTKLQQWNVNGTPRRAGVSSFGIGGTNAHVILEEAPHQKVAEKSRHWQLLMLSAKTDSALEKVTNNLIEHLKENPDINIADVAYTLLVGRRDFEHRRIVVCQNREDAIAALQNPKRILTSVKEGNNRPVAFIFTGLGTHYVNMGWELYQSEQTFRQQVDICCDILSPILNIDLRDILYPNRHQSNSASSTNGATQSGLDLREMLARGEKKADDATQQLNQTHLTQPAVFVIEYALAQLWMSWGIRPVAMMGYSIGEYVAACVAGVLSLEDALTLIAKRAQMIQELPTGAMLAVPLSEKDLQPHLGNNLSLSAINGSSMSVVAGTNEAVARLEQQLSNKGLAVRRIETSHAFHSHMMNAIAQPFTELVKTVKLHPPQIPYLSNVTGTWISAEQATNPSYWTQHLCQTVRFADGVQQLWQLHQPIFLEIGAGQTLGSLALQCLESVPFTEKIALPSLRASYERQSDLAFSLKTLGQLWLSGISIDWSRFYEYERRHRLPLPTYPFERQRFWLEPRQHTHDVHSLQTALEQKLDITDWFHIPSWKRTAPPGSFELGKLPEQKSCWLIFVDECGIGSQIAQRLELEERDVTVVKVGEQFSKLSEREYTINPEQREDYDTLLKELRILGKIPQTIAHCWTVTSNETKKLELERWEQIQFLGFYSLLFLAQALGEQNITDSVRIDVISNNLQELTDADELCPEKATILGSCKVIPQEYANINCRSIDIALAEADSKQWQQLIERLVNELIAKTSEQIVAYRGDRRWIQCFEPFPVEGKTLRQARLRQGGVYIITGGLGGIGSAIARHLAKTVQAKLVLIGRSELPPKTQWQQWLSTHNNQDTLSQKIERVRALEELGAEVLVIQADVTNLEQMQQMVQKVGDRFGEIHGVIHAAGVPGAGLVQLKTPEMAAKVLEPKVKGTLVLNTVLKDIKLDFLALFSSMTSLYGGFGQVDYCAANAFLDAFAHDNSRHQINTVSINWDWWQWDSWQDSLLSFAPEIQTRFKQMRSQYGITFQEGIDALGHILSSDLHQVVVSTRNLQDVIKEHQNFAVSSLLEQSENTRESKHLRPNLRTAYVSPRNELEHRIAEIYQELLGIEQVGIYDNFFDLGGHSLIGTQLISQLRRNFQIELSMRLLFDTPSVAELALAIQEILLEELENLTEDGAEMIILNVN